MSGSGDRASNSPQRTDTMIGAGMRVKGDIAFSGVLRVQGDVLGNIACANDADGTVVVDGSGSVTGMLHAPHIVVRGRVAGPLHSSQSIDIQKGACVLGEAFYKEIDIHEGGVVEGMLVPTAPPASSEAPALPASSAPEREAPAGASRLARLGSGRLIVVTALLVVASAAAVWLARAPTAKAPREAAEAPAAAPPERSTPSPVSAPPAPRAVTEPPATVAAAEKQEPVVASNAVSSASEAGEVVAVQGVNPAKPAGVFLLVTREPTVLFRKKRQDGGDGKRVEVSQGRTISIAIARNEIIRVAEGRDLDIFYQGRKVPPRVVESGTWMSFVPQSSRATDEEK